MIRRVALLVLVAAAVCIGGAAAWAHWGATVSSGANGAATAASVNSATIPTASLVAAQKVTLTWSAVTLSNGVAVDGYIVKRYNSSTLVTDTVLAGCAGTITATTCTESSVPIGTWRYSVYPKIGANWVGTESALTPALTVATPTLTLAKYVFGAPLPVATTGTVSGFGVNEAISYRLDAGTTLTGFPSVVDTTGGAPISSLTIPSTTEGSHTVYVLGANGSIASTVITVDTVAPAVLASPSPAANGAGWNSTSPVTITLSATDATSGVASIKYTTDGSDPTVSGTVVTYGSPFTVAATATVRYYATDVAGNASAVSSQLVKIDTVAPANSLALSSVTGAALSGTTVYYQGVATGSFTVTNTVTDAGSGPASSSTAALGGTTTGFTHSASTVSTPSGGPYVSNVFSWTAGTTSAPTETVTGADVAGKTTGTALSFVNDSTAPSGGSVDASGLVGTGSRYSTSTALSVAFSKGTDAGVGLAPTGALLQRQTATLSLGVCGSYGAASTLATDPTSPYANTVTDQACYRYLYVVADSLGNSVTYTSGDVKVDTTVPSAPTLSPVAGTNTYVSGTTVYYNGGLTTGSFTVTASSTDAASNILSYSYPSFGTNWSNTAGSYSWSGAPAAPGTKSITATNNATLTNSSSLTLTSDTTAPSGGSVSYTAGYLSSASRVITFTPGTDGGSGLQPTAGLVQRSSATMTAGICGTYSAYSTIATGPTSPYTDTTMANGTCNKYQYVSFDNVNNQAAYTSANVVKAPLYYTCAAAVAAAAPLEYFKLNEASGATATDSSGNSHPGTYVNVGTYNVAGACGQGVTFTNAATGLVGTAFAVNNPLTWSTEIWFKSTATGVRLIGFGNSTTGTSSSSDRHIYLNNSGNLVVGAYTGILGYQTIASPGTYNDGNWHQAVATMSAGSGVFLYVDGSLANSSSSIVTAQNFTGYWRIGTDNLMLWPGAPAVSNNNYVGSVSNGSVYTSQLTATQVMDHYIAGYVSSAGLLATSPPLGSIQAAAFRRQAVPPRTPTPSPQPPAVPSTPPPALPSIVESSPIPAPASRSAAVTSSGSAPPPAPSPSSQAPPPEPSVSPSG